MPRVLPWQTSAAKPKASGSTAAKRERAQSSDEDILDEDLNPMRPSKTKRVARATSSLPAPALPKFQVEYMQEGWNRDDIYMMVEDEFEALLRLTALNFHVDAFEAAKEKFKHKKPGDYVHYTDGKTDKPKAVQLRHEMDEKERMINHAMGQDESDDDIDDPHLAGLMSMPIRPTQDLSRFAKVQSSTRAAAGYKKSPEKPTSTVYDPLGTPESSLASYGSADESDDLDRPVRRQPAFRPAIKKESLPAAQDKPTSSSGSVFAQFAKQPNAVRAISVDSSEDSGTQHPIKAEPDANTSPKIKQERVPSDGHGYAPIKAEPESSTQSFMAKRRAERERRRKEEEARAKEVKIKLEVPTFII